MSVITDAYVSTQYTLFYTDTFHPLNDILPQKYKKRKTYTSISQHLTYFTTH